MRRVGLFLLFIVLCGMLLAYPQPMGRLGGAKTNPLNISALSFYGSKLYTADRTRNEIYMYDLSLGNWQATGIKYALQSQIVDIYVDEGKIYLLDAKSNSILTYDLQGKLLSQINTKGVKELGFKKAKRILVNYQGFIYVMDSAKLYALSQEGMLMASIDLEKPVSMSLGEDQLIRVLQHTKTGSEIVVYDLNLVRKSRTNLANLEKKANFIIDFAVNLWGEMHAINSSPVSIIKYASNGKVIPDTQFGSVSKGKTEGAFEAPAILKCGAYENSSLMAIYDAKQSALHLFQDTEPQVNELLGRPTYTVRPSLVDSKYPLARDYLATADYIYTIGNMQMPNTKGKPGPAIIKADRAGKASYVLYLQKYKDKKIKDFTALALSGTKLYVLDGSSSMIHVFNAEDGAYQKNFGGKSMLNRPSSMVVASDGNLYVADTGNRRISVFNQHDTFVKNIELQRSNQGPILLRSSGEDLYCLTSDFVILRIPLAESKRVIQMVSIKGISSFDIIADGKIAFVEKATQKLRIYKGNVREFEYFTKSSTAAFPHFADIYLLRYDAAQRRLAIMDSKAPSTRFLYFYAALDDAQSIQIALDDNLQTKLSWERSPGINNWIVQATDGAGTISHSVSQPEYVVIEPQAGLVSYIVYPVADDGKKGLMSDGVSDHFSHARYLYQSGQFNAAVEAYRRSQAVIRDPRIDGEIVKCHIAESDRFVTLKDYENALNELRKASLVQGTNTAIALKAVNIYQVTHNYLGGVNYLQGVDYKADKDLLEQYIVLKYLAGDYDAVVLEADRYSLAYGRDEDVRRYLAGAYEARGDFADALSAYQELVARAPKFEDELKIAELQFQMKQYRAAESQLQLMLTRYSTQSLDRVRNLLGKCNLQSMNYGLAIDHYTAAIRINSDIAEYHHGLGTAYASDNKHADAQRSFLRAHQLAPNNAVFGLDYAKSLERQGNIESALRVMESVAEQVATNATAVDFHVLFADLLRQTGRIHEALGQITKAKSYHPDDFEISQKFADISAELQVQNLSRDVIEIRHVNFNPVFPSLNEYYKSNPIGNITLYNNRSTTVNNVKVTVYVQEVGMRAMVIDVPSVVPRQDKLVDIPMEFNERLFDRARTVPVTIELSFEHEGSSFKPSVPPQNIQILDSKAMDWGRRRSIASFVNPQDNNLSFFVRQNIVQAFSGEQSNIINRNLIRALQAYSFYRANGITYVSDSAPANLDASQLDEVPFPHQILQTKAGDCEDLLVLLAGTLESIGTRTALIDVPGHVILGVNTEMNEADIRKNGLEPEYFIEYKGSFWLPIETTLMGKADFVSSWLMAIKRYNEVVESGIMPEIIEFSEAHLLYPPSSYSKAIDASSYQKQNDARSFYHQDLAKISNMSQINREMSYVAALEKYPSNNSVRLQYALFSYDSGNLEQAERLYKDALNREPANFAALINLGNLYAKSSRYSLAKEQYEQALPHAAGKEDQVYRNLCLLEYRNMNRAKAVEYFNRMTRKEIIREVDMQIYADLVKTGD